MGERQPLKLRPDPGEYRCTWTLVDDGGGVTEMPGDLELREDDAPRGYMYGDQIPVEWQGEEQRAASFPQRRHYARVVGKLINGHEAVLIETDLLIWAPDRAILHPRAALVGDHIPSHTSPRFVSIKVQITGLDIMAGIGPLKAFSFPTGRPHLEGTWSVEGEPESSQQWTDGRATLRLDYDGSFSMGNPYFYRMSFSPVATIELAEAATFDECLNDWVQPLHRLTSLTTGRPEKLTYLALTPADSSDPEIPEQFRRCQVYGSGILQRPYTSSQDDIVRARPAFRVKADDVPLLDVLRAWRRLEVQQHPFMESFGSTIVLSGWHPRSRYLLLIQAFEGLHGYETREGWQSRRIRHTTMRNRLLAAVQHSLYMEAQAFLKKHLSKSPMSSLDECLRSTFRGLPIDVTQELGNTELVQSVQADPRKPDGVPGALRLVRNDLSHGTRSYDVMQVHEVATILNRAARAHLLRLLGCDEKIQTAALAPRS